MGNLSLNPSEADLPVIDMEAGKILSEKGANPETFFQEEGVEGEVLTKEDLNVIGNLLARVKVRGEYQNQDLEERTQKFQKVSHLETVTENGLVRYKNEEKVKTELTKLIYDYLTEVVVPLNQSVKEYNQQKTPEDKKAYLLEGDNMEKAIQGPYFALRILMDFANDQEVVDLFFKKINPAFFEEIDVGQPTPLKFKVVLYENFPKTYLSSKLEKKFPILKEKIDFLKKFPELADISSESLSFIVNAYHENPKMGDQILKEVMEFNKKNEKLKINLNDLSEPPNDDMLKSKKYMSVYFKFASFLASQPETNNGQINVLIDSYMDTFNRLYEGGFEAHQEDQMEIAKSLPTNVLMEFIARCGKIYLNISHKVLMWNLNGNPSKKIPSRPTSEIIQAFRGLSKLEQQDFMVINMQRSGRDAYFLDRFDSLDQEEFLGAALDGIFRIYYKDIEETPGLVPALNDPKFGPLFSGMLASRLDPEADIITFASLMSKSRNFAEAAKVVGIDTNDPKFRETLEYIDQAAQYNAYEAMRDGEHRSVTMFAWDPEHVKDSETDDKSMQLSDFWDTFKTLRDKKAPEDKYEITSVNDGDKNLLTQVRNAQERRIGNIQRLPIIFEQDKVQKIVFEKNVGGIRVIHELVLSNNNAHGDFREFAEAQNENTDPPTAKYDQIAIRGHCWTNEEAVLGTMAGGDEIPIKRDQHLTLVNGGCFQESNTEAFSNQLGGNDFQVATTQTGMGSDITKHLSIIYQEKIVEHYVLAQQTVLAQYHAQCQADGIDFEGGFDELPESEKQRATVDMKQIDKEIRENPYFKKVFNKFEGRGYRLTAEHLNKKVKELIGQV